MGERGTVVLLFSLDAFANGRHVGIRAADVALNATIEDRTGTKHLRQNVQVLVGGVPAREIEYRLGESSGKVALSAISRTSMASEPETGSDYVKAEITKADGIQGEVDLGVKKEGVEIMITGKGFGMEKIALLNGKHIELNIPSSNPTGQSGEQSPRPPLSKTMD